MTDQEMKELAEVYGIEIEKTEPGQGGLFFVGSEEEKIELKDIFSSEYHTMPQRESISFEKCNTYSTYTDVVTSMLNVAA